MRDIDEDTITQAVIAQHATVPDARLREVMTSLVQHLHTFARDARLTEAEWAAGVRFLAECAQADARGAEVARLSDTLGLTALVAAASRRLPRGCTETALTASTASASSADDAAEPCFVRGSVARLDGTPVAGAQVQVGDAAEPLHTDAQGRFLARTPLPRPQPIAPDGPVGRLLRALDRPAWRPAHLRFRISAAGHAPLVTQVFRRGDPHLDADAAFGARRSLVADWPRHEPGPTPDGGTSAVPFTTVDFDFVLDNKPATGDTP